MFRNEDTEFYTIPAAPGWYVSVLYKGLDYLTDEPIVAWEIERWADNKADEFCRTATPICTENYFNDGSALNDGWFLRDPAGRYHSPHGAKYSNAEDALADLKANRAKRLARTLKAVKPDTV
jgi:hypothetical protein